MCSRAHLSLGRRAGWSVRLNWFVPLVHVVGGSSPAWAGFPGVKYPICYCTCLWGRDIKWELVSVGVYLTGTVKNKHWRWYNYVAFPSEERELGQYTKSSMSHKVHQCQATIHLSLSRWTHIDHVQKNHGVCHLIIVRGHWLCQGVELIDLNCVPFTTTTFFSDPL